MYKKTSKKKTIRKINAADDLLELNEPESVYVLNDEERKAIDIALEQVRKGQTIPHEQVMKEMREWLKKSNGRLKRKKI